MDFHFESAGEGPALLFLHAGVADSRMWRDQMGLEGHRTIAYDRRGFGRTEWVAAPYSDRMDALSVLDQLGVASATIVGCSMGGGLALELAIEHPDRVDGLVLVGAAPSGWEPEGEFEDHPLWEQGVKAFKKGNLDRVAEIESEMWLIGYGRGADSVDPALRKLFLEMDRIPLETEDERNEYVQGYEEKHNDHLNAISAPTLVIVGGHDEPFLLQAAEYLAGRLSDQPAVVIDDTAHLPSLERPAEFNQALTAFLETL